jgi:predicted nucleic acid-binding protein
MTIAELLATHTTVSIDSNIFIYVLEASPLGERAHPLFTALEEGRLRATLSSVAIAEILAGPARRQDVAIFETYAAELRAIPNLRIVPVDADVAADAAWLRGAGSISLADAVHLACARRSGATAFITNDRRIRPQPQLDVIILEDLDAA